MQNIAQPLHAHVAITVNYGTNPDCSGRADPNEAAAWVNYANNVKQYGIKYWTIGNEWPVCFPATTPIRSIQ